MQRISPLAKVNLLTRDSGTCSDLNGVVMDYLVSEGYPDAAAKFAKEANIPSRVDVDTIHERVEIRNLIYREQIQEAIEKINEINPQVSTDFHFHPCFIEFIIFRCYD